MGQALTSPSSGRRDTITDRRQQQGKSKHDDDDDDDHYHNNNKEEDRDPAAYHQNDDVDRSSSSHLITFVCEICIETTPIHDSFNPTGCTHFYCTQCKVKYVDSKLSDNGSTRIPCPSPGCPGLLDPELCRQILPRKLFDRWGLALVDSAIDVSHKVYCPYADCSVLLIHDDDDDEDNDGNDDGRRRGFKFMAKLLRFSGGDKKKKKGENVMAECPFCERMVCVKCKSPWHSEMDCETYQRLKGQGEEKMLEWIAKLKKWQRCPNCTIYVARRSGCSYIKCRCGTSFCYRCASPTIDSKTHYCLNCHA